MGRFHTFVARLKDLLVEIAGPGGRLDAEVYKRWKVLASKVEMQHLLHICSRSNRKEGRIKTGVERKAHL